MTLRQETPCLYLAAPRDHDAVPWCGLGYQWPGQCRDCLLYEATWAPPDAFITAAWRLVNTGYAAASEQVTVAPVPGSGGTKPPPKSMG